MADAPAETKQDKVAEASPKRDVEPVSDVSRSVTASAVTASADAKLWAPGASDQIYAANATAAGWTPRVADITSPAPIYARAQGITDGLGTPPRDGDRGATMGDMRPGDVRAGAPTRAGDAKVEPDKIKEMLGRPENAELNKRVEEMRRHIDSMAEPARSQAGKGLDQLLMRGTTGYEAPAHAPKLEPGKISDTIGQLNKAMGTDKKDLSSLMGSADRVPAGFDKSEREVNRDLIVAQALRNYGDSRGVQQTGHQTCLLDGKIADQARKSPETSAAMLTAAMTSKDGTVTVGGRKVELDASYMRPDSMAWNSRGGETAVGMSGDVRMLTGIYANALTQPRGEKFTMGTPTGQGDTGDRLVNMRTGDIRTDSRGRPVDDPVVTARDAARLNEMTGDKGMVATNAAAWDAAGLRSPNFADIRTKEQLADLIDKHGSVQVGLNAHILWNDGKIGAQGGGHMTSVVGVQRDANGGVTGFMVQDTNTGKVLVYDANRMQAAINNDKGARPADQPTTDVAGRPAGRHDHVAPLPEGVAPTSPRGQAIVDTTANPRGLRGDSTAADPQYKPETDADKKAREHQEQEQQKRTNNEAFDAALKAKKAQEEKDAAQKKKDLDDAEEERKRRARRPGG